MKNPWDAIALKVNRCVLSNDAAPISSSASIPPHPYMSWQTPPTGISGNGTASDPLSTLFEKPNKSPAEQFRLANEASQRSPYAQNTPSEPSASPPCPTEEKSRRSCCAGIGIMELRSLFPAAQSAHLEQILDAFNAAYAKFEVDTCLRKAHFFAQIRAEVGPSASLRSENLTYTPIRLIETFGYFRRNREEAQQYGQTIDHPADEEAIANRAYANRLGNGDIDSGDGWTFRGRGFLQLTGRSNYAAIQEEIDTRYPDAGLDILQHEADLSTVKGAMISALAFWSRNGLNAAADAGLSDDAVDGVTAIINQHTDSYPERRSNAQLAKTAIAVDRCARNAPTSSSSTVAP